MIGATVRRQSCTLKMPLGPIDQITPATGLDRKQPRPYLRGLATGLAPSSSG